MRVLKWDKNFNTQKESSLAPVRIRLPDLPLPLFNKEALTEIAQVAGKPLKITEHTKNRSRPNHARICIEIDILKERLEMIVLQMRNQVVNQKIFYENVPKYCSHYHHMGHNEKECYWLRNENDKNILFQKKKTRNKNRKGASYCRWKGKHKGYRGKYSKS